MYTNVIETTIAGAASISDLVIYITDPGKEGVFKHQPGTPPYTANGATIIAASGKGYYERVFDSAVNVKWFGAVSGAVSNQAIQDAIDFIINNSTPTNYNLYFPKGIYLIDDSTGSNAISVDLSNTAQKRMIIYGDGMKESTLMYVGRDAQCTLLYFKATLYAFSEVKDLALVTDTASNKLATGLKLDGFIGSSMNRVSISNFDTGILFSDVVTCQFDSLFVNGNNIGINAQFEAGNTAPPNLLGFNSCSFAGNSTYAVYWNVGHGLHSVAFNSCGFEGNGSMDRTNPNNPVPVLNTGGLYFKYSLDNGANGLNLNNCYFEANSGTADVHLVSQWYNKGTHTFQGNTFNRNTSDTYCINNILVDGLNVTVSPVPLGNNKTKLSFIGNGFFTPLPPTGSYIPDASRRTIQLNVYNGQYWEFDVVELGNTYASDVDKPSFYENPGQIVIPQISEYNRMLASARASDDGSTVSTVSSYNIASIIKVPGYTGTYQVNFANSLLRVPVVQITAIGTPLLGFVTFETNAYIEIKMVDLQGVPTNGAFDLLVF